MNCRFWSVYVQLIVQVFCLVLSYDQVVQATRGAHSPNLQVVITHGRMYVASIRLEFH